jgi:hypothetical protein
MGKRFDVENYILLKLNYEKLLHTEYTICPNTPFAVCKRGLSYSSGYMLRYWRYACLGWFISLFWKFAGCW